MSTIRESQEVAVDYKLTRLVEWWPVLVGLLALYFPTYWWMAQVLWTNDDYAHGPIVVAVMLWSAWRQRLVLARLTRRPSVSIGAVLLIVGLLVYAVGRSQGFPTAEVLSQLPVFAGILVVFFGLPALKVFWFPMFFSLFLVPLPSTFVAVLTGPLKLQISSLVASALYKMGYPIAVDGVVLQIGSYQLMVADACSGLHSMFSLTALGVLYLYLMKHREIMRNALVLISIWPIAFLANALRVLTLVLITYHMGDEAGQGFLHGFAGILVFMFALAGLIAFDSALGKIWPASNSPRGATK